MNYSESFRPTLNRSPLQMIARLCFWRFIDTANTVFMIADGIVLLMSIKHAQIDISLYVVSRVKCCRYFYWRTFNANIRYLPKNIFCCFFFTHIKEFSELSRCMKVSVGIGNFFLFLSQFPRRLRLTLFWLFLLFLILQSIFVGAVYNY